MSPNFNEYKDMDGPLTTTAAYPTTQMTTELNEDFDDIDNENRDDKNHDGAV